LHIYDNCIYCAGELYDTYCEPADENAVQEPNDIQVVACPLEVDHNENKQCVNSNKACNANTASACMSDDDHLSQIVRHVEVLSHFSCQANDKSDVTVECQFDSTEISETLAAADTSIASVSNSQYNAFTLSDSYCGTECELSQSQRLQLTNTQKLKMFAMELHMMNVPAMTHSSQNSLFDSLTDMSAMLT